MPESWSNQENRPSKVLDPPMRTFVILLIASIYTLGCDYHVDSVYLGRREARLLADVNAGDLVAVKKFLDQGGNVNLQDEPGMTPLHHAVNADHRGSHLEIIQLLIARGANVKAIDDTHHTPLHLAGYAETAELLLRAGANVNARTKSSGETLLNAAAWGAAQGAPKSYEAYLDLTKLLLANGADVNLRLKTGSMIEDEKPYHDKTGDTVLHQVARSYSEQHASTVCELLISHGAEVNAVNIKGHTPLDEAVVNERSKTADFLRQHGAKTGKEINAQDPITP